MNTSGEDAVEERGVVACKRIDGVCLVSPWTKSKLLIGAVSLSVDQRVLGAPDASRQYSWPFHFPIRTCVARSSWSLPLTVVVCLSTCNASDGCPCLDAAFGNALESVCGVPIARLSRFSSATRLDLVADLRKMASCGGVRNSHSSGRCSASRQSRQSLECTSHSIFGVTIFVPRAHRPCKSRTWEVAQSSKVWLGPSRIRRATLRVLHLGGQVIAQRIRILAQ